MTAMRGSMRPSWWRALCVPATSSRWWSDGGNRHMGETRVEVKTTCPRDCYDGCGVSVVLEGGRIRSVKGDADHFVSRGSLCGKCSIAYNGAWIDPRQRLAHPQKRVGRKGSGQFVMVGWDEALGEIAERL